MNQVSNIFRTCEKYLTYNTIFFKNNCLETKIIANSGQVTLIFPGTNIAQFLANNNNKLQEPEVPTPFCLICTVVMKYLNSEIKDKSNQV